jgi:N-acetylmuramoyl-L-alanine amidase
LAEAIEANFPDVKVIMTRNTDKFIPLNERAAIATRNKADLFISIHCNATKNPAMKGPETYVMGLHKSQANLNIAKLENAAILLESDYQATYEGFDPNADESYILFSLYQNSNLEQSTDLAAAIQSKLAAGESGGTRGVRQAGFMVLYKTTMPSVLVEAGYISNPEEEKYLMSEKGQDEIVTSIYKAFRGFMESYEPAAEKVALPKVDTLEKGLVYKVQVAAAKEPLDGRDRRLSRFAATDMYRHGGLYKYTVGGEPTLEAAEKLLAEARKQGAADAFIVIFRNGSRIPEEEARRLLGK